MWRNFSKRPSPRKIKFFTASSSCSGTVISHSPYFFREISSSFTGIRFNHSFSDVGIRRNGMSTTQINELGRFSSFLRTQPYAYSATFKGCATAAQAIESTDPEDYSLENTEIQELIEEMGREVERISNKTKFPEKQQPKKMVGGMVTSKYYMLRKRQLKMETEAWDEAAKEYQDLLEDMCQKKLAPNLPYVKSLFLGWFEPLRNAIQAELDRFKFKKMKASYARYMEQLPADMMAVITMHKMMGLLLTNSKGVGSVRVVQAACQIGEAVEHEARINRFLEKTKTKKSATSKTKSDELETGHEAGPEVTKDEERLRKKVSTLMKKQKVKQVREIVKEHDNFKPWGQEGQAKVGSRLIQLLMENAYVQPPNDQIDDGPPEVRPAFVHSLKTVTNQSTKSSRRYGVIECDPLVRKGLENTARHMVIPYMPMLIPPQNWSGYDRGAYFFLPSYVMRTHGAKQQRDAIKRTPTNELVPVFEALDTLGNTKWRINKRVLSVVEKIWTLGGRLAGLVDREDVSLPEEPDTEDETKLRKWKWAMKTAKKENSERHSQRCDIELKLAVARKMKNEEGFYYPHNLDFRGRAYPMHPHLNHLGSDLCRGVLEFAVGKPLGKSGLRWLKIHLANLYAGGVDKLSYEGRIAFTENHLEDIFDSADRPLEGRKWWLQAEDPLQCLASCINLTEALRSSSPETVISHLPVHQDGSCNGLQHYAALGRDKLGAVAVNLVAGEKPADVYSGIAARVLEIIQQDADEDPNTNPNAKYAKLLVNQVDRKLVKQTVMTSVYGVTYIGARDQIKKRLKERGGIGDDSLVFGASCYAAKTTLTALGEMFEAARSIMSWLGECAKIIASQNKTVCWTTPLGLPVVQPYRQLGRHMVKTSLQVLTLKRETDKVMVKRQRTAFPPNFVHSLDGSHMMMTAVACKRAGLSFAGVHDSYWTHACDVDEMNRILREKFVQLYETPILENLLESFQNSFPDLSFPPLPDRGDFDLRDVLQSPYFFN